MSAVFELSLKRILKQRLTIILMMVFPIIVVLIPQSGGEIPIIGYGLFGLILLFSAFLLTKQVIEDRQYKTIVRIAAAPITHRDYLVGHLAAYMMVLSIQVLAFWVITQIAWAGSFTFHVWALLLLVMFALLSLSFSLFWHTFFKTYATSIAVYSIAANLMALVGGMSYPLEYMPDDLRRVAVVLPTYWYAYGFELIGEARYFTALISLCILGAFAIIFLTIGSRRRFE